MWRLEGACGTALCFLIAFSKSDFLRDQLDAFSTSWCWRLADRVQLLVKPCVRVHVNICLAAPSAAFLVFLVSALYVMGNYTV